MRAGLRAGAALLLALAAGAAMALPPGVPWSLQHPAVEPVPVRGLPGNEAVDAPGGGMLYPAPNLGGFLAAVITHGILVESTKNAARKTIQEQADLVLGSLRPVLASLNHAELLAAALQRLPSPDAPRVVAAPTVPEGWLVTSAPAFAFTQDLRTLVLDNAIAVFPPGERTKPLYATVVRVRSRARQEDEVSALWRSDDGRVLKAEAAHMLAHALALAFREGPVGASDAVPFRTLRYREGEIERMERAQELENGCGRLIMRNLRGWLLSVPVAAPAEPAAGCRWTAGSPWR